MRVVSAAGSAVAEQVVDVGSVEFRLEEEGIVAFVRVDGDVEIVDVGLFEVANEFGLFFGVDAEVGVDGEDEVFVPGFAGAGQKLSGRFRIAFAGGIVAGTTCR